MIREAIEEGGRKHLEKSPRPLKPGGLPYTARLAQCEADQALAALAALPESALKED